MELRGFEPLTPCMPCKCSAKLSYSPKSDRYFTTGSDLTDRRWLPSEARGISPKTFEIVMLARLGLEQVDNHVTEIDQQPDPVILTFDSQGRSTLSLHLNCQFICECDDLTTGVPAGNHECFRDLNEIRYIEQSDLPCLFGVEDVGNSLGGGLAIGIDRNCRHSSVRDLLQR